MKGGRIAVGIVRAGSVSFVVGAIPFLSSGTPFGVGMVVVVCAHSVSLKAKTREPTSPLAVKLSIGADVSDVKTSVCCCL